MSVSLNSVSFEYLKGKPVLNQVTLTINPGDSVFLTGPNGAGKSTLLKLLNGILKPDSGTILIDDLETRSTPTTILAGHIAVTFQNPADQIFSSTVRNEIMFGAKILRRPNPTRLAEESMEMFGLEQYASSHPYDLSPAHRRLLTIASAVATGSSILAFDEPTTSLPQPERLILLNALKELTRQERTLLIVSHDLEFTVPLATRMVLMNNGGVDDVDTPYVLLNKRQRMKQAGVQIPISLRIERMAGIQNETRKLKS